MNTPHGRRLGFTDSYCAGQMLFATAERYLLKCLAPFVFAVAFIKPARRH